MKNLWTEYRGWLRLIGIGLFGLIVLFKVDLARTWEYLTHANAGLIALAVVLFVPFLATKAWRWQVLLADLRTPISFGEAWRLYALGLGAGMVTPGQVGDAVKALYLRERGLGRALLSVVLDRLWDLLTLLLLAGSGAFAFWREFQGEWIALALLLVGTVALFVLALNTRAQQWVLTRVVPRLMPKRVAGESESELAREEQAAVADWHLSGMQLARQFGLTVLATGVVYLRLYLLVTALDIHLAAIPFVAAMSLASVAALIPVSVSGIGTRDAALMLIAPALGISPEQAIGISTLILFLSVVNGAVGLAVYLWETRARRVTGGG